MSAEITTHAGAAAITSATAGALSWGLPFEAIGISAAVLFMAFAGTAAGLVVQPPSERMSRIRMFGLVAALTGFAAVSAVFLRELGILAGAAPAVAFMVGLFSQALLPAARERLRREVQGRRAPPTDRSSP